MGRGRTATIRTVNCSEKILCYCVFWLSFFFHFFFEKNTRRAQEKPKPEVPQPSPRLRPTGRMDFPLSPMVPAYAKAPAGRPTKKSPKKKDPRFIIVTGGVCSSLGKGIAAASIGAIMKACGLKVFVQKLDPYLNVDPGTMSPFQHGEVYVTDDGAETDLDLGHYERFIDEPMSKLSTVTTGQIYQSVLSKERQGE